MHKVFPRAQKRELSAGEMRRWVGVVGKSRKVVFLKLLGDWSVVASAAYRLLSRQRPWGAWPAWSGETEAAPQQLEGGREVRNPDRR